MSATPSLLSVKVVVRDSNGRCLLLKRSRDAAHHPGQWEFPGGKVDPHESFDHALLREVAEETGLSIRLERVVGSANSEMPGHTVAFLFMEGRYLAGEVRLSDEHEEFCWAHLDELLQADLCPD